MSEKEYENLLKDYTKYKKEKENSISQGIHDYSLMNALLKKTDEVNLHSNFIYSMINPNSSHYCGNVFLDRFLKSIINEDGFINLNNARVYKENGKIDLLIEDGEHVLIIENKLRAVDQRYQISRYIQYAIKNYLDGNMDDLENKVRIVYLSEYKAKPSKDKESLIGFTLDNNILSWIGESVKDKTKEKLNLDLPKETKLKFNRVKHSNELYKWIEESKKWLSNNNPNNERRSLIYAFDEYELILKRLKTNQWRKIMSLDEHTLKMDDIEQEEKMYSFMCEAKEKLNDYLAKKLYREINELFPDNREVLSVGDKEFKKFDESSCINWFKQKNEKNNKYKDVGFIFDCNNKKYYFILFTISIAYGKHPKLDSWDIKTNRKNLQTNKNKNLFELIEDLKKLKMK